MCCRAFIWFFFGLLCFTSLISEVSSQEKFLDVNNASETASKTLEGAKKFVPSLAPAGGLLIALGLSFVFLGLHFLRTILFMAGFLVLAPIAYLAINILEQSGKIPSGVTLNPSIYYGAVIGAGVIGGIIASCLEKLGRFAIGAAAGYAFSLWMLSFKADGLIDTFAGQKGFEAVCSLIGGLIMFSLYETVELIRYFIPPILGSYCTMLGIDCFAGTGLRYGASRFVGYGTTAYQPTGGTYAMLAFTPLLTGIGSTFQLLRFASDGLKATLWETLHAFTGILACFGQGFCNTSQPPTEPSTASATHPNAHPTMNQPSSNIGSNVITGTNPLFGHSGFGQHGTPYYNTPQAPYLPTAITEPAHQPPTFSQPYREHQPTWGFESPTPATSEANTRFSLPDLQPFDGNPSNFDEFLYDIRSRFHYEIFFPTEIDKINYFRVHVDSSAQTWLRELEKTSRFTSYSDLESRFIDAFSPRSPPHKSYPWLNLRQRASTVKEFLNNVTSLAQVLDYRSPKIIYRAIERGLNKHVIHQLSLMRANPQCPDVDGLVHWALYAEAELSRQGGPRQNLRY